MTKTFTIVDLSKHYSPKYPDPLHGKPGCYVLKHKPTGKFIVGSTCDLGQRRIRYRLEFERGEIQQKDFAELKPTIEDMSFQVYQTMDMAEATRIKEAMLVKHVGGNLICNSTRRSNPRGRWLSNQLIDKIRRESDPEERRRKRYIKAMKPVTINGITYESMREACKKLQLHHSVVQKLIDDKYAIPEHPEGIPSIKTLDLSTRAFTILFNANIRYVSDLLETPSQAICDLPRLGPKLQREVFDKLTELRLKGVGV